MSNNTNIIVTENHIQQAFDQIHESGNMEKIMTAFSLEQRSLLTYLFLMQEKLEFEDDFELLLLLGTSIWLSYKNAVGSIEPVSEALIMNNANAYMAKLKHEGQHIATEHSQTELLAFVEQMIKNHQEDKPNFDLKSQSIIMTTSHILIDALEEALKK
ncbi:hypothetical protein [Persicobacter psychrovividus]|uniref:DUF4375 domain-containing protein n=1 Tax=Persicobacter psychrovividus TaxID=387638 RepID=A0ABM7VHH4_9BACT|nr:hypothetical protein PEPS_27040 [Persicobacter psychrovividus]